jgi:hypothetical protein
MRRHRTELATVPMNPHAENSSALVEVFNFKEAKFLATESVEKKGRDDDLVAFAFERAHRGRPRVAVADRRRFAFVALRRRTFDPAGGIKKDRVAFAEMIEQSRERG